MNMKVKEYLKQVAYLGKFDSGLGGGASEVYYSKFDDSYITHVGMEDNIKHLADIEITKDLTHGVGFSPKDNKWYGWSHRAIFGFEIGSECKKGDCHYVGSSIKEQEDAAIAFRVCDDYSNVRCEGVIKDGKDKFFDIRWDYKNSTPNKSLHNTIGGSRHYITPLGRGEWIAKTLDDARLMAIDFNEGVS
jgi:hypothetical protein